MASADWDLLPAQVPKIRDRDTGLFLPSTHGPWDPGVITQVPSMQLPRRQKAAGRCHQPFPHSPDKGDFSTKELLIHLALRGQLSTEDGDAQETGGPLTSPTSSGPSGYTQVAAPHALCQHHGSGAQQMGPILNVPSCTPSTSPSGQHMAELWAHEAPESTSHQGQRVSKRDVELSLGPSCPRPTGLLLFLCRHSSCVLANQARGWIHLTTNPYKRKESFSQPGKLPKQFTMYPRKCQW